MITSEYRIMRGPNMWSANHHVIAVRYNPLEMPETDFEAETRIKTYFAENSVAYHHSEDSKFDVFRNLLQLTCALQQSSSFEIVSPTGGISYAFFNYDIEQGAARALRLASEIILSLVADETPLLFVDAQLQTQQEAGRYREGPTTSMIVSAAIKRNIPVTKGPAGYTFLGYGKKQRRISAAMSHHTSCIAVNIAGDKEDTKEFLKSAHIPVPAGRLLRDENDLLAVAEKLGYPLVTKPFNGNQGRNVTCGIDNFEKLLMSFRYAKEVAQSVIIEKEIQGRDYRLLVIGSKFIAASLRQPASVVGDGTLSIAELIEKENLNPLRGNGHENILTKISIDSVTELHLLKQNRHLIDVPQNGEQIFLRPTANLSTGGIAEDVTELVHPSNILLAEKVARVIGLDICGIDVICPDISQPLTENGGAVIEVNAAPGLRMHKYPTKGLSREVGEPIVDLMFPEGDEGRIPIVAITGTNGKTTTTRLMAHLAASAGYTVGFSSTDGIYIGSEKVQVGDCSGPQSARTILHDTTVDFAVLECARGGIIRSGLGFDACDVAIVTNVAADHLGLKDIYTVEDLAKVKAVVPSAVKENGWAILNAGDKYCCAMIDTLRAKVALFCTDEENIHLQKHMSNGGTAVFADSQKDVYIFNGKEKVYVFNATEAPITRGGKAEFMIENILPVILTSHFYGMSTEKIASSLKNFIPNAEQTPGRINELSINGVNVIVDYAHNPHGLKALAGYLKNIEERKLGIIAVPGDRRDEDIIEFGRIAGETYDDIIIRFDRDTRGRTKESIVELLEKGIHSVSPGLKFQVIPDTQAAIHYAVEHADKGSYVIVCADNAVYTLSLTNRVAALYT